MDNCKHILKLSPARDHSVLNPQKWHCEVCGTTESVWACLSCPYVACGRYISEHAIKHYHETKHPLTIEVNEKYVYCYECEEYVLNDNAAGDIKILRSCLRAVATQSFQDISSSHHRLLRSHSFAGITTWKDEKRLRDEDLCYTAIWFRRYYILAKVFNSWKKVTKGVVNKTKTREDDESAAELRKSSRKKRTLVPGVTGLRNLGNTCYMNSVLQVLSNVQEFRYHFLAAQGLYSTDGSTGQRSIDLQQSRVVHNPKKYQRQTTMECFQHISESPPSSQKGGLNGGGSATSAAAGGGAKKAAPRKVSKKTLAKSTDKSSVSLCEDLHALLRVMWSGKWALVSPHKMLQSVWTLIPFFKGYSQQDAQEFLCEFLDKLQGEIDRLRAANKSCFTECSSQSLGGATSSTAKDVIDNLFQGELVSEVRCIKCGHKSCTYEPFMDLSLDFHGRYHWQQGQYNVCIDSCHLHEMLTNFIAVEKLEGKIYACEKCNKHRRRVSFKPKIFTEAEKKFLIHKLPRVLRLHLKRFTWAGRNHRGKISVPVKFEEELDLQQFRQEDDDDGSATYRLVAVVMHHGRGFGSGHYTAYCWNSEALKSSNSFSGSWVHCNDSKITMCTWDDVRKAQAYILIYVRKDFSYRTDPSLLLPMQHQRSLFEEDADEEITFNFKNSTIPKFVELKRKLAEDPRGRTELKRRRSNVW